MYVLCIRLLLSLTWFRSAATTTTITWPVEFDWRTAKGVRVCIHLLARRVGNKSSFYTFFPYRRKDKFLYS